MVWAACAAGAVLAAFTLLGAPWNVLAFFLAPLAFAALCVGFAPPSRRRKSLWLFLAGAGSFSAGFLASFAAFLLILRLQLPSPLATFTIVLPGALVASLLFVHFYLVILRFPRRAASPFFCIALALAGSVVFALSFELAQARPWFMDNRVDGLFGASGPYIFCWFLGLALIFRQLHRRTPAA